MKFLKELQVYRHSHCSRTSGLYKLGHRSLVRSHSILWPRRRYGSSHLGYQVQLSDDLMGANIFSLAPASYRALDWLAPLSSAMIVTTLFSSHYHV